MSPYFRNLLKSIGHDYMAPDARVYNTKQYLDGGRVGFENGKKVKNIKQGESSLLQAEQRLENSLDDIDDFAKGGLAKLLGE